MAVRILIDIVQLYIVVLFVRIIFSWFPINPWSKFARVVRILEKLTDPVLVPVRKLLPPLRIGGAGFDLSPIIVFLALEIVLTILRSH